MLSIRQRGSRGTDTSSHDRATRAISATVCSGSGTCSRTSIAVATSNSPSANGRFSAFITRYSRLGAWRCSHSAWIAGSSRSMPTTRRSPSALARRMGAGLVVRRRDLELQLDAADALEDPLGHDPLAVEEVAEDAQRAQHDGGVEEHGTEDQRLHVAGAVAADVRDDEARERDERGDEEHERESHEDAQRLVLRVDAGDRDRVAAHVG